MGLFFLVKKNYPEPKFYIYKTEFEIINLHYLFIYIISYYALMINVITMQFKISNKCKIQRPKAGPNWPGGLPRWAVTIIETNLRICELDLTFY